MIIDTNKTLSTKIPFYGVIREVRGTVIACARRENTICLDCVFAKTCAIYQGGTDGNELHDMA